MMTFILVSPKDSKQESCLNNVKRPYTRLCLLKPIFKVIILENFKPKHNISLTCKIFRDS